MNGFDHDNLDVYKATIDFVALADEIVEHLPRARGPLRTRERNHRTRTTRCRTRSAAPVVSMLIRMVRAIDSGTGTGTGTGKKPGDL